MQDNRYRQRPSWACYYQHVYTLIKRTDLYMGDSLDPHSNPYYKNLKIEDLIYINFPGDIGKVMNWRAYQNQGSRIHR